MIPERWQQIRKVFDEAVAFSPEERATFLDRACGDDAELRREVESLLVSDGQAGTQFLNRPAVDLAEPLAEGPVRLGRRIGPYNVLEELGRGGMGEVYRAARADGQYEKEVAIKLVRGGYDTAAVLNRFRHERQILASLDHPNIARLLDGGTTGEGTPYLVMELIEGTPIDQYCDAHQVTITERLRIFLQVCAAVQYAHQRLVIHRDIKPGNILVTKEGVPKLLDFGIAKILDTSSPTEATVAAPMTPEYASPEQVRGEPITTATDVYSLGVVLYGLLTGRSPYSLDTRTPHEIARAICEHEPVRPSAAIGLPPPTSGQAGSDGKSIAATPTAAREGSLPKLRRRLTGDLDDIVMMSLRKESYRRYASVEQFAEDIRLHLNGRPVAARRDSWRYRATKFVGRHKVSVAASAVVVIAVAGGVAATIREARIAAANEHRAEQRFNDVRKLANSLMFEIHDAIRDLPGSTPARRLLVTRAQEYLDSLSHESKGDPSLQRELAAAYERVGDVLGFPYGANLGDKAGALDNYRKALTIRESLAATSTDDTDLQRDLAATYIRVAQVLENEGNFADALANFAKSQPIMERLGARDSDPVFADQHAGSYYFTAGLQVRMGNLADAEENYQRSASIRNAALQRNPDSLLLRTHLAADYAGIAKCFESKKDVPDALEMQSKAVAILQDVSEPNPQNAAMREYLGEAVNRLATYRIESGDPAGALEMYRKAHEIFSSLVAADPKNSLAKSNFGFSDNGIAKSLIAVGQPSSAVKIFQESIASFEQMSPRSASNRYLRSGLADAYSGLGDAYSVLAARKDISSAQRQTYWAEVHSSCQKSLDLWKDKEKRGELESGESENLPKVEACVTASDHGRFPQ